MFQDTKEGAFILAFGWGHSTTICTVRSATGKRATVTKNGCYTEATWDNELVITVFEYSIHMSILDSHQKLLKCHASLIYSGISWPTDSFDDLLPLYMQTNLSAERENMVSAWCMFRVCGKTKQLNERGSTQILWDKLVGTNGDLGINKRNLGESGGLTLWVLNRGYKSWPFQVRDEEGK